ncbi:MAG: ParB/RepB/Spo0J family partition protein [Francisellaceae bacterium]|nr:ParB/RepB/Spo0J family partition protein [Francisellaceae bacterium]
MRGFKPKTSSIFSGSEPEKEKYCPDINTVQHIAIDEIFPCQYQARTKFDDVKMQELSESIKEEGLLQPIVVRRLEPNKYELISGERRYRAHILLDESHIRAIELEKSDKKSATLSLIENVQRENLSPIEEALGYKKIIDLFEFSINKVAKITGKSRSHISNLLRVLVLPDEVKNGVHNEVISLGHAKVLLSAVENERRPLYEAAVKQRLSVRELEVLIKRSTRKDNKKRCNESLETIDRKHLEKFAEIFNDNFGVKLDISVNGSGIATCLFSLPYNKIKGLVEEMNSDNVNTGEHNK